MYWQAITLIEAQETLKSLIISDWPNLKNTEREKRHRQLHMDAYPDSFNETKQVGVNELARILSLGVPKKG